MEFNDLFAQVDSLFTSNRPNYMEKFFIFFWVLSICNKLDHSSDDITPFMNRGLVQFMMRSTRCLISDIFLIILKMLKNVFHNYPTY